MDDFNLSSAAFGDGSEIPTRFGYKHGNHSPPLTVANVPGGCKSIALIMDDPDAMKAVGKVWTHWIIWNIPPQSPGMDESSVPDGSVEGVNDFGQVGYGGPAPPDGRHTYVFRMYALNSRLDLQRGSDKRQLEDAMQNRVVAEARLEGTFAPDSSKE